jgi:arginase
VKSVRLLSLPYHRGEPRVGMGAGPPMLLEEHGLVDALEQAGIAVEVEEVGDVEREGVIPRTLELDRRLAARVREALEHGALPLVLSGNCNSCLGTVAGLGEAPAVVWFDAHADFDTPEDNQSGFFDVLSLALLTGTGWNALDESIEGFQPVEERNVALVGVRDLEPYQARRLESSAVRTVYGADLDGLETVLDEIAERRPSAYLHVDLDSLDPSEGRANEYAAPGGLALDHLRHAIRLAADRFEIRAAAVTAYDPGADPDRRMARTAVDVVVAVAEAAV